MNHSGEIDTVPYFLVLLRPGPGWSERERHMEAHGGHIDTRAARGVVLLGGDFVSGFVGWDAAYLVHTTNRAQAEAWARRDPLVRSGVSIFEIVEWQLVGIAPSAIDAAFVEPAPDEGSR